MKKILFVLALLIQFGGKVNAQTILFTQDCSDAGIYPDYFCANSYNGVGNAMINLFQCKFECSVSRVRDPKKSPNTHFLCESSITGDIVLERKINKLCNSQKPLKFIQQINFNAHSLLFEAKGYTEMAYCFVRPS